MMRRYARTLLATGALAVMACQDHPVEVGGDRMEAKDAHAEFAASLAVAADEQEGMAVDPFRPRLGLDARMDGELVPEAMVTLVLEGVANEKLTGGKVRLVLPTTAAMGVAAAKQWDLPTMDAGEAWRQEYSIKLPGEGYYLAEVEVDAAAPADDMSPYVIDASHEQIWMFVADAGGRLTRTFDEAVFPDSILPQPGPFRTRMRDRTTGASAAGVDASAAATAGATGADGTNQDVKLKIVYRHRGTFAAVGGKAQANFVSQSDTVGRRERLEVPTGGIVAFSCPDEGEWIEGTVKVPSTTEVAADYLIGRFEANRDDCGETRVIYTRSDYYLPWKNLNDVIPKIDSVFGYSRGAVKWRTRATENEGSSYNRFYDRITFRKTYYSAWTAAHEYGHALHNKALGGGWDAGSKCTSRDRRYNQPTDYLCAFKEGFADYAGNVGAPNDLVFGSWEKQHYDAANGKDGTIEANVAALFHDLIDDGRESGDLTSYPGKYIADVFKSCWVTNSAGRRSHRNKVSDFVWCLEKRVDQNVHEESFPGVATPRSVSDSSTKPDGWNADDIRSTWKKNVG